MRDKRYSMDSFRDDLDCFSVKRVEAIVDPIVHSEWAEKRYVWAPDRNEGFLLASLIEVCFFFENICLKKKFFFDDFLFFIFFYFFFRNIEIIKYFY